MDQRTFLNRLGALAKLSGLVLEKEIIGLYDGAFKQIGYDKGVTAIEHVILNRRSRDPFPSIADLKRVGSREPDEMDQAVEASNRIVEAVSKFGGCNADLNAPQARKFMGDIAWYVVERNGGFVNLCSQLTASTIGTFKAQFRELALSSIRRYKLGLLEVAPSFESLPTTTQPESMRQLVADTAKKLEVHNDRNVQGEISRRDE